LIMARLPRDDNYIAAAGVVSEAGEVVPIIASTTSDGTAIPRDDNYVPALGVVDPETGKVRGATESDFKNAQMYPSASSFPPSGATGVLYIDQATGTQYYWNGTGYQPLPSAAPTGGYVDSFDFGTLSPTRAQITAQVATEIWGAGTLDSSNTDATQWTFTVTDGGAVHSVMEIFNGTRIRNLYQDDGAGGSTGLGTDIWEVAVSATTAPPVFSWAHIGQEARAAQIVIDGQPYSGTVTLVPY
jgi:hypothetical protein